MDQEDTSWWHPSTAQMAIVRDESGKSDADLRAGASTNFLDALTLGQRLFYKKRFRPAFKMYKAAADTGSTLGMFNVGVMNERGWGMNKGSNRNAAFASYLRASSNLPEAAHRCALFMLRSENTKTVDRGKVLISQAVERESRDALLDFGMIHMHGLFGFEKNEETGRNMLHKSAEMGSIEGAFELAMYLEHLPDKDEAARHYARIAADGNHPLAQDMMGQFCVKDDKLEEARQWFERAVGQNMLTAMRDLGAMCEYGKGGDKDEKRAVALYKKGHSLGDSICTFRLGVCHERGKGGLKKNRKRSQRLVDMASEKGCAMAKGHILITNRYTPNSNSEKLLKAELAVIATDSKNPQREAAAAALVALGAVQKCLMCNRIAREDGNRLLRCGKCHAAFYCSRECQRKDWDWHKTICVPKEDPEKRDDKAPSEIIEDAKTAIGTNGDEDANNGEVGKDEASDGDEDANDGEVEKAEASDGKDDTEDGKEEA